MFNRVENVKERINKVVIAYIKSSFGNEVIVCVFARLASKQRVGKDRFIFAILESARCVRDFSVRIAVDFALPFIWFNDKRRGIYNQGAIIVCNLVVIVSGAGSCNWVSANGACNNC